MFAYHLAELGSKRAAHAKASSSYTFYSSPSVHKPKGYKLWLLERIEDATLSGEALLNQA